MTADRTHALPRAILFDMDGTLTEPLLDFPRIKAEMGIGQRPILEALAEMDEQSRHTAELVLLRHEEEAAVRSTLNAGCRELLSELERLGIATALITRNSRASVNHVLTRHELTIRVLVAREDAPPKPDPQPLLLACQQLRVNRDEAWMVGDGQYDIEAARAAGIASIWISHGRKKPFAAEPWKAVRDLHELRHLLSS
ncbi:MAG TPA: HAD family hydrolase [Humisphaera sp.]|jgi:HAD superfamily hydrolase (TIGR01549 family)|nr:HAD family hydrolase [Humisphaera sp.]